MFKHIPNILTIIRFLLIPFILLNIFTGNYILAFVLGADQRYFPGGFNLSNT